MKKLILLMMFCLPALANDDTTYNHAKEKSCFNELVTFVNTHDDKSSNSPTAKLFVLLMNNSACKTLKKVNDGLE